MGTRPPQKKRCSISHLEFNKRLPIHLFLFWRQLLDWFVKYPWIIDKITCLRSWIGMKPQWFFFAISRLKCAMERIGYEKERDRKVHLHDIFLVYRTLGFWAAHGELVLEQNYHWEFLILLPFYSTSAHHQWACLTSKSTVDSLRSVHRKNIL